MVLDSRIFPVLYEYFAFDPVKSLTQSKEKLHHGNILIYHGYSIRWFLIKGCATIKCTHFFDHMKTDALKRLPNVRSTCYFRATPK